MRIARIKINNFANFSNFEVSTGENLVIVGENKVGKSNLVFAMQLVLDPGLSDRDRQLTLDHFWDGLGDEKLGATVEIAIDLTDYDTDPRLVAHLGDCIVDPGPPMTSRLTYRFQPQEGLINGPTSLSDYEYLLFGGLDPNNTLPSGLRRMLPLDVMSALRDVEKDLATWRRSPLRPLIEAMGGSLDDVARTQIQSQADAAQAELIAHPEVSQLATTITHRLINLVGTQHSTSVELGLAPTRVDALLRALRLLIDGGNRGIIEASLGTANLIFLALKSLEVDQLVQNGERDHTFLAVEEPEAHLHPHVQRLVYRYFLGNLEPILEDENIPRLTTILTTHSPHIASVAPLRSIVLLRYDADTSSTIGVSTANTPLLEEEVADLERYIDVTRGELFFARGIVLVEGDAERFLLPAFASVMDIPLDVLGITVCSVGGTNFGPYVKLLSNVALDIPFVLLTDRDVVSGGPPLGIARVRRLLEIVDPANDHSGLPEFGLLQRGESWGIFVNANTLEPALFERGLGEAMHDILTEELSLRPESREALAGWVEDPDTLDAARLLRMIERVGKGRFAQRLAPFVDLSFCPTYIRLALERIRDVVSIG